MKKYIFLFLSLFSSINLSAQEKGLDQRIDEAFQPISEFFSKYVFYPIGDYPFVIYLLVGSALFFTIYFGFPNLKYFWTAINVVRGKYDKLEKNDNDSKDGEVSHFQALATAVSGTVGNGNIAGVALAIALGGPGATFWMIVCGLLGMSTKFVECTLGVYYRDVDEDGVVYGGPMYYISKGLKSKGFKTLGTIAASLFAIFCIGGSFGGGNAAQSNQATIVIKNLFGYESTFAGAMIGIVLAALVGIIIIGGIKRIASVTEKVVPFMALLYILACIYILTINFSFIDDAIALIIREAFNPTAVGVGGIIGVLMVGFQRAAFSNEAGAGSASIAHSAFYLDKNSKAEIYEKNIFEGEQFLFFTKNLEIELEENAHLVKYYLNSTNKNTTIYNFIRSKLQKNSVFEKFNFSHNVSSCRDEIISDLNGRDAYVSLNNIQHLSQKCFHEIKWEINHNEENTKSSQFVKSALHDESVAAFQGKIYVNSKAQKTDGYQLSRALLLSDQSKFLAKPELEIYADDVKCSHGSSSGSIDQESIFYLRSRGISEQEAKKMMIEGFLAEVINKIKNENIKNIFYSKLNEINKSS